MTKVLFSLPTGLVRGIGDFVKRSGNFKSRQAFYQSAIIYFAAQHEVEWKDEDEGITQVLEVSE